MRFPRNRDGGIRGISRPKPTDGTSDGAIADADEYGVPTPPPVATVGSATANAPPTPSAKEAGEFVVNSIMMDFPIGDSK